MLRKFIPTLLCTAALLVASTSALAVPTSFTETITDYGVGKMISVLDATPGRVYTVQVSREGSVSVFYKRLPLGSDRFDFCVANNSLVQIWETEDTIIFGPNGKPSNPILGTEIYDIPNVTPSETIIGISFATPPDVFTYYAGEDFDPTGLTVTVTYQDGKIETIQEGFVVLDGDSLDVGQESVTVEYEGVKRDLPIAVIDPSSIVSGIEVSSPPNTTDYYSGDSFISTGLTLTVTFKDGHTTEIADGFTVLDGLPLIPQQETVTIEYFDVQCELPITVIDSATVVTGFSVMSPPDTSEYHSGDTFDPTGITLLVTYRDGHEEIVDDGFIVPDGTNLAAGQTSVTVLYENITRFTPVTVIDSSTIVTGIEVAAPPLVTTYYSGDDFDPTGLKLLATYKDGHCELVTSGFTVADGSPITATQTSVTIEFQEFTCSVPIEVTDSATIMTDFFVTSNPIKSSYYSGDNFDSTGLVLTASFRDGHTEDVTSSCTFLDGDSLAPTQLGVIATYNGFSCTIPITIIDSATYVDRIEIITMPTVTEYYSGSVFDPSGLTLKIIYHDGQEKIISEGYRVVDGNPITNDQPAVIVEYESETCVVPITIVDSNVTITDLVVDTPPTTTAYYSGDPFDSEGLVLLATYRDGSQRYVPSGFTVRDGAAIAQGQTTVTVEYEGFPCFIPIMVIDSSSVVASLRVETPPDITRYYSGESFDSTGLSLIATYRNGFTERITDGYTVQDGSPISAHQTAVTIVYRTAPCPVPITVIDSSSMVTSVEIATLPHATTYYSGDTFNPDGLSLLVTYKDGHTQIVTDGYSILDGTPISNAQDHVTVLYAGHPCSIPIEIIESSDILTGLKIESLPNITAYYSGDDFNPTGLVLTAYYRDGRTESITEGYTITDGQDLAMGQVEVTVVYESIPCLIPITVMMASDVITSIRVASPPDKTDYQSGEPFESEGLALVVTYRSGHTEIVSTGYKIRDGLPVALGQPDVTVEYQGAQCPVPITVSDASSIISRIDVATPPNTTHYYSGDPFDPTGTVILVTYEDGHSKRISSGYTVVDGDSIAVAQPSVSYAYEGFTCSTPITVTDSATVLVDIAVDTPPTTTAVYSGDKFDPAGLVLELTFRDRHTETTPTGYKITNGDPIQVGQTYIEIEYGGFTTTTPISVTDSATVLVGIAVDTPPTTTNVFSGDKFDPTGLVLELTFRDGHTETTSTGYTITNGDPIQVGQTYIEIEYQGFKTTTPISTTDSATVLVGIAVDTPPTTTNVYSGDVFDPTGLILELTFRDGHTETTSTGYAITNGNPIAVGQTFIEIAYQGFTTTTPISVTDSATVLVGIAVDTPPTTTNVFSGDVFDPSGLVLKLTFRDGHTETTSTGYTITNGSPIQVGQLSIEIEYQGFTTTTPISVTDSATVLTGIRIHTSPNKTAYYSGDPFVSTGLVLALDFRDGHTETTSTGYTITNGSSIAVGQTSVTVSYQGFTRKIPITVTDSATVLTGIVVRTAPTKTEYNVGDAFVSTGLTLTATYRDGHTTTVSSGYTITNGSSLALGQTSVTISYGGFTTTASITVIDPATIVTGIAVSTNPSTTSYLAGENFNSTGLRLKVTYKDGHTEIISSGYTISNGTSLTYGQTSVTANYKGFSCSVSISVARSTVWKKYSCDVSTIYTREDDSEASAWEMNSTTGELEITCYTNYSYDSETGKFSLSGTRVTVNAWSSADNYGGLWWGIGLQEYAFPLYYTTSSSGKYIKEVTETTITTKSHNKFRALALRNLGSTSETIYSQGSTSYGNIPVSYGSAPESGTLIDGSYTGSYCVLKVGGAYYYYVKQ